MTECATRYLPSRDQLAIAADITVSLDKLLPLARLHAASNESDETWHALNELGLFGITLDEDLGGSGLGATEETLIAMGLGRRLVAPAVIASMGARHAPEFQHALFDVENGRVTMAYRRGGQIVKVNEVKSPFLLIRHDDSATLAKSGDASQHLDSRLWLADLHSVSAVCETIAVLREERLLRLRLLDAAVLAGVAETALEMAVAYAGVREQFGRPIGSFQAVKHHCANMAVASRRARDQTSFAAVAIDTGRSDAALQAECAFLTAGGAALENAGLNIQIHGGIGFSDEADPHLLLKRARLYIYIGGGLESAASRVADIAAVV